MKHIQLPCNNLIEELDSANGEVAISGQFTSSIVKSLSRRHYEVLDLFDATFGSVEEEYSVCLGMSHSGPVYGRSGVKTVDLLTSLIENIEALEIILPDDVAKRHLNAVSRNKKIYSAKVSETCKLFSMKDGCVYNKKQTILVFTPRPVEYVECADCGKKVLKDSLVKSGYGTLVCSDCRFKGYEQCFGCGAFYHKEDMKPGTLMDWVLFCPDCVANGMNEM